MPEVTIVVPCYNEAERLDASTLEAFARAQPDVSFLLVDDGSRDATLTLLREIAARLPDRFSVLALRENVGKAEAVRQGVLTAAGALPRYVGFWDADLATPLDALADFRRVLDLHPHIELAMGSRVQLLGRQIERSRMRHYLGRLSATAISLILGMRVYDTQCGAKLFRATPAMLDVFSAPFRTRWLFDVEILARMIVARRAAGAPPAEGVVYEMPLVRWRDVAGSKLRSRDYARALLGVATIYWTTLRPGARSPAPAGARETAAPRPGREAERR